MVKIEEEVDGESDDECCEIDPAEFARKVQLKVSDEDVILVAAKGLIKVEENQPEGFANALDISDTDDSLHPYHEYATGDRMDCPYEVDEDDKLDKGDDKYRAHVFQVDEDSGCPEKAIPDKSPAKVEPEDRDAAGDEGAYDLLPEINVFSHRLFPDERRAFDEEDDDDVVVIGCTERLPSSKAFMWKFPLR